MGTKGGAKYIVSQKKGMKPKKTKNMEVQYGF
jgi:hypothetical protein